MQELDWTELNTAAKFSRNKSLPVIKRKMNVKRWTQFYPLRLLSYNLFKDASKAAIYYTAVIIHRELLKIQRTSRWPVLLSQTFSLGTGGGPCTTPVEKRTADLQWMIIHGAIATDGYVAHLNPAVRREI